jgi:hypothetical protein
VEPGAFKILLCLELGDSTPITVHIYCARPRIKAIKNLPENLPGTLNLPKLIKTGNKLAPSPMNVSKLAPSLHHG